MIQKINSFAVRAFRDTADRDYIHARMSYRADLYPQFLWSSLHALEKYGKCILILNRIPKPKRKQIQHEVLRSLQLLQNRVDIKLSKEANGFIERLEKYGAKYRYLDVSWFADGPELAYLDRAVWELRRYCNSALYIYKENEEPKVDDDLLAKIKASEKPGHENTYVTGGFLEKVLESKNSVARKELVWCNLFYSKLKRKSVRIPTKLMFENSPFFLNPEIIDEVEKYAIVSGELKEAYKNG